MKLRWILYPVFGLTSLAITIFSFVFVNWWAPLFADEDGYLPKWLYWFQTFDAPLDASWKDGYLPASWGNTRFKRYWARVYWMYRNPCYGIDYFLLGLPFDRDWKIIRATIEPNYTNFLAVGNGFNFCYFGKFGTIKIGWKAWNYYDQNTGGWKETNWGSESRVPLCLTFNPFRRSR